eukprot:TRINITY_DN5487_c0_g1_i7.p1 TRINITY_DN5487_c0_g1~~TRINITY_DN5487_c0_g1_i7.p1  ORF type:complete len:494 (+),score=83.27 TRINITY_DN5487_c0_g1_i7:38-1519(+)
MDWLRCSLWCCYGILLVVYLTLSNICSSLHVVLQWEKQAELLHHAVILLALDMLNNFVSVILLVACGWHLPANVESIILAHHFVVIASSFLFYCGWMLQRKSVPGGLSAIKAGIYSVWLVVACMDLIDENNIQAVTACQTVAHLWRWLAIPSLLEPDTSNLLQALSFEALILSISCLKNFAYCQRTNMPVFESWANTASISGCHVGIAFIGYIFRSVLESQVDRELDHVRRQQEHEWILQQQQKEQLAQEQQQERLERAQEELKQKARLVQETKVPLMLLHGALQQIRNSVGDDTLQQNLSIALTSLEAVVDDLAGVNIVNDPVFLEQEIDDGEASKELPQADPHNQGLLEVHLQELDRRSKRRPWPWGCGTAVLERTHHAMLHMQQHLGDHNGPLCRIRDFLGGRAPSLNSACAGSQAPRRVTVRRAVDWNPASRTFITGSATVSTPRYTSSEASVFTEEDGAASSRRTMQEFLSARLAERFEVPEPFSGEG